MEFVKSQSGARLVRGEKTLCEFVSGAPLCVVGTGKNAYSMSHGSFKIKEKIDSRTECRAELVDFESADFIKLNSALGSLDIQIEGERLCFVPHFPEKYNRLWIKLPAQSDEKVYGCGETFTEFDLRGKKVNIWVAEHINAAQLAKKVVKTTFGQRDTEKKQKFANYETYYAEPTFLSSRKYYFHAASSARCVFDFTNDGYHLLQTDSIAPFYIGFGDTFAEVVRDLTLLLGRQPELPDWVYDGAILGIQGGTDVMLKKVDAALDAGTAVCGVWIQDWEGRRVTAFGKQLQWNWEWDEERYPALDKAIKELNEKGIRVLGYVNTFLAVELPLYKEAHEKGYCVKNQKGEDYYVTITTFPAAIVDLTNPKAYEWLKNIIKKNMIDFGFSGWMADFGEYLPTDSVLFSGEDPELIHNRWAAIWAKLNREAVEESGKLGEIMFFTRAGHTDTKKYSTMMWNGDNHVDYSIDFGLPSVIPASLSLTCCGFGLSHSDVGGYTTFMKLCRSPELFMRWAEMNAFTPLMRGHEGSNPDLNAQFDANGEVLALHAKMSRVHKALKPYLKACVAENAQSGLGVIRPLFFHYDEEEAYTESYEYLLGRDILVAPVLRPNAVSRRVYLPNDEWVHLWSGNSYSGGRYDVQSPVGEPPVFVRKGYEHFQELIAVKDA